MYPYRLQLGSLFFSLEVTWPEVTWQKSHDRKSRERKSHDEVTWWDRKSHDRRETVKSPLKLIKPLKPVLSAHRETVSTRRRRRRRRKMSIPKEPAAQLTLNILLKSTCIDVAIYKKYTWILNLMTRFFSILVKTRSFLRLASFEEECQNLNWPILCICTKRLKKPKFSQQKCNINYYLYILIRYDHILTTLHVQKTFIKKNRC